MATRVQSAQAEGNPASATFGSTPIEDNLLIATTSHRSGPGTATISGTGWTLRVDDQHTGDNQRQLAVWTKLAGASEATNIQTNFGAGVTNKLIIEEYELEAGEDQFVFLEATSGNNGETDGGTSQSTGATGSVDGPVLVIAGFGVKIGGGAVEGVDWSNPTDIGWTNGLTNDVNYAGSMFGRFLATAYLTDASSGSKESTGTPNTAIANEGLTAALLVFSLVAGGGGDQSVAVGVASAQAAALGIDRQASISRDVNLALAEAAALDIERVPGSISQAVGLAQATAQALDVDRLASVARAVDPASALAAAYTIERVPGSISRAVGLAQATAQALDVDRLASVARAVDLASVVAAAHEITTAAILSTQVNLASALAAAYTIERVPGTASRAVDLAAAEAVALDIDRLPGSISREVGLAQAVSAALQAQAVLTGITAQVGLASALAAAYAVNRQPGSVIVLLQVATAQAVAYVVVAGEFVLPVTARLFVVSDEDRIFVVSDEDRIFVGGAE